MTKNYIEWLNHGESKRHNLATEHETHRNNVAVLEETNRHNVVNEIEYERHNRAVEGETNRHNLREETVAMGNLEEQKRSHRVNEELSQAQIVISRDLATASQSQAQASLVQAAAAQMNARTNAKNADINQQNADTASRNASTNALNAATNKQDADTRRFDAESKRNLTNAQVDNYNIDTLWQKSSLDARKQSILINTQLMEANIEYQRNKTKTETSQQALNYAKSYESITEGNGNIINGIALFAK